MNRSRAWTIVPLVIGAPMLLAGCGGSQGGDQTTPEPAAERDGEDGYHRASSPDLGEDDDDGLQIEGLGGRLGVYEINQGIQPHAGALDKCHTSNQGRRRYIGGEVELAFVVHPDGKVKSVRMIRSDLGAWPMEQCLLDVGRQIVFPEPEGNGEADFTVPLSFAGRGRVITWDQTQAQAEVAEHLADLAACAQETGVAEPQSVLVTAYVGTRGQVQSVGFATPGAADAAAGATALDQTWAECAEAKALAWTLTDPMGQIAKMTFAYPAGAP